MARNILPIVAEDGESSAGEHIVYPARSEACGSLPAADHAGQTAAPSETTKRKAATAPRSNRSCAETPYKSPEYSLPSADTIDAPSISPIKTNPSVPDTMWRTRRDLCE